MLCFRSLGRRAHTDCRLHSYKWWSCNVTIFMSAKRVKQKAAEEGIEDLAVPSVSLVAMQFSWAVFLFLFLFLLFLFLFLLILLEESPRSIAQNIVVGSPMLELLRTTTPVESDGKFIFPSGCKRKITNELDWCNDYLVVIEHNDVFAAHDHLRSHIGPVLLESWSSWHQVGTPHVLGQGGGKNRWFLGSKIAVNSFFGRAKFRNFKTPRPFCRIPHPPRRSANLSCKTQTNVWAP